MSKHYLSSKLIERFASLYAEIEAFRPTYDAALERRDVELERRTGILRHWGIRSEDEAQRHMTAMRIVDEEIGFAALNNEMEARWSRLDPVVKAITNEAARDLTGLALKANATATAWERLWEELPEDLDHNFELIRDLIESVCAVAGVDLAVNQRLAPRTDLN